MVSIKKKKKKKPAIHNIPATSDKTRINSSTTVRAQISLSISNPLYTEWTHPHYILEDSNFDFRYVRLCDLVILREKWFNYLQTVNTPIRCRILWRLIWVCTVCQWSFHRSPDYNGLSIWAVSENVPSDMRVRWKFRSAWHWCSPIRIFTAKTSSWSEFCLDAHQNYVPWNCLHMSQGTIKSNKIYVTSKDSDQPIHPPSMATFFFHTFG